MHSPRRPALFALAVGLAASAGFAQDAPPATAPAKVNTVEFRKLKDALPATLAGLPKGDASGQRTKAGEMTMATAEAPYGTGEGDAPKTGKITLLDYGNDEFAKGMTASLAMEIDQESDKEYTRTTDVQGRRALITYNSAEKRGSCQTLAGGRVIVTLEMNGVSDDEFKKAIDELPLKAVDALVAAAK